MGLVLLVKSQPPTLCGVIVVCAGEPITEKRRKERTQVIAQAKLEKLDFGLLFKM